MKIKKGGKKTPGKQNSGRVNNDFHCCRMSESSSYSFGEGCLRGVADFAEE
jgi:hypothetical protein